jgi:hypothetical protein
VAALAGAVTAPKGMPRASTAAERLMPPAFLCPPGLGYGLLAAARGLGVMQQSTATSGSSRPTIRS